MELLSKTKQPKKKTRTRTYYTRHVTCSIKQENTIIILDYICSQHARAHTHTYGYFNKSTTGSSSSILSKVAEEPCVFTVGKPHCKGPKLPKIAYINCWQWVNNNYLFIISITKSQFNKWSFIWVKVFLLWKILQIRP